MTTAATVDNGDLFEIAHPDAGSATGYASNKQSLAAIADHMATAVNHPTLNTTAKNIVGAINELEAGGGGGGSSTLAGLTDVAISSPTNGQSLVYDSTAAKWKNGAGAAGGHTYSTTEQVVGTWIDGKPLYEKTIEITNLSISANGGSVSLGIANVETIFMIAIKLDTIIVPYTVGNLPQYGVGGFFNVGTADTTMELRTGEARTFSTGFVIVRYTKTTDN